MNKLSKIIKRWRFIPKVSFIDYKKSFPNVGNDCFTKLFDIRRAWGGRLVYIHVKARAIELDFRRDWILDMIEGTDK